MAIAPVASPSPPADATALGSTRLAENFDTFLTLLTTQLKNQDPLSPLDSNQFTQQMVSMTGVEQQIATNQLLKQLVGNTGSNMASAVGLIGKNVRATSDAAQLAGGQAGWIYSLDQTAASVKLEVLDASGRVVHAEMSDGLAAGDHEFVWDGKGPGGARMADGTYTLRVSAAGDDGGKIAASTSVQGLVTAIEQSNGDTLLTINGGRVPWNNVTVVNQAGAAGS